MGYRGKSYAEAAAMLQKYQPYTAIFLEDGCTLQRTSPTTISVTVPLPIGKLDDCKKYDYYYQYIPVETIIYESSGAVVLNIPNTFDWRYSQALQERLRRWSHFRVDKKGKDRQRAYIIAPEAKKEVKIQKCRTCHGYIWQGEQTESRLLALIEGTADWDQRRRHSRPCWHCGGTGKRDYGGLVSVPYRQGLRMLPNGTFEGGNDE